MRRILSLCRRCVEDYDMIQEGDSLGVGVSGGKDSLTLLAAMAALRSFYPKHFTLSAFTVEMGTPGMDFAPVAEFCRQLDVPYFRVNTQIHEVLFHYRKEKNPCSLCAKMRRGALHEAMLAEGVRKVCLGHHYDDAVETFFLSLFYEGRLSCFQPVTELDRTGVTQIRPLLYCGEGLIAGTARRLGFPVVENPCPANGNTKRQEVKELVARLSGEYPRLKDYVFGAMQRLPLPAWGPVEGAPRRGRKRGKTTGKPEQDE